MITREQLKINLENSIKKVQSLIYASVPNIGIPKIKLVDTDYNENTNDLYMVLISVEFSLEAEPQFYEVIETCDTVRDKLNNLLNKVSFNDAGNLKSPRLGGGVTYIGEGIVESIRMGHNGLTFFLDFMFTS
jgi:hypothetical protein